MVGVVNTREAQIVLWMARISINTKGFSIKRFYERFNLSLWWLRMSQLLTQLGFLGTILQKGRSSKKAIRRRRQKHGFKFHCVSSGMSKSFHRWPTCGTAQHLRHYDLFAISLDPSALWFPLHRNDCLIMIHLTRTFGIATISLALQSPHWKDPLYANVVISILQDGLPLH